MFEQDTPLELIQQVRPTVLVKGGDYRRDQVVGREVVEAQGGEVIAGRSGAGLQHDAHRREVAQAQEALQPSGDSIRHPTEEHALVREFFGGETSGYFVEVGANHPTEGSQTWHLEQAGWTGVLVEPQPDLAAFLVTSRKARVFADACSSPDNAGQSLPLHVDGPRSALDRDRMSPGAKAAYVIVVPTRTLDSILEEAGSAGADRSALDRRRGPRDRGAARLRLQSLAAAADPGRGPRQQSPTHRYLKDAAIGSCGSATTAGTCRATPISSLDVDGEEIDRRRRLRLFEDAVERPRRNEDDIGRLRAGRHAIAIECRARAIDMQRQRWPALSGDEQASANTRALRDVTRNAARSGCGSTSTPVQPACSRCQVCEPSVGWLAPTSTK